MNLCNISIQVQILKSKRRVKVMKCRKKLCGIVATSLLMGVAVPQQATFASESYFSDDFESGSQNWNVEKGSWNLVSDGSQVFSQTSKKTEAIATRGDKSWTDYSVKADVKVIDFNGSNKTLLCGRYTDAKNYYAVSLSNKNGGTVELKKKVNGSNKTISKASVAIEAGSIYNVKLEMVGTTIKVYINDALLFEKVDSSLSKGEVGLIASKVSATYDNVKVTGISTEPSEEPTNPTKPTEPTKPTNPDETNVGILSQYSVTGFSTGNQGGGAIDETSPYYKKVTNATELAEALNKRSNAKVIEIMNDINLGWNELPESAKGSPFGIANTPLTHPILKETGVSKLYIKSFDGLTIYSKNGAKLKHVGVTLDGCKNVVVRNVQFDELWEWDEATKGNYDRNDWDYFTVQGCKGVWIDHCTFGKAYDGVIDSKKGTTGLTISWSKFLPGDITSGGFYAAMFEEMEKNPTKYPMYNFIKSQGLSKEDIMKVAAPQKKTHLIGSTEFASDNADLQVTLHHNYYKDSQDRMPRLRGGNAHAYNVVMDATGAHEASKLVPSVVTTALTKAGYHFGISSNGALSTEGGAVLVEKSQILGVQNPLRNNQKDPKKANYTGKIKATDTIYKYEDVSYRGDSDTEGSPLAPNPVVPALSFSWNGFAKLPYNYIMDDPVTLIDRLTGVNGAGAGSIQLSSQDWLKTNY
jgi:pectate lyase